MVFKFNLTPTRLRFQHREIVRRVSELRYLSLIITRAYLAFGTCKMVRASAQLDLLQVKFGEIVLCSHGCHPKPCHSRDNELSGASFPLTPMST